MEGNQKKKNCSMVQCIIDNNLPELKNVLKNLGGNINDVYSYSELNDNVTPLIVAVVNHKEDILSFLLQKDADPNKMSQNGLTPLHYASLSKAPHAFVTKLLEYNADPNACDLLGEKALTPLQIVAIEDRSDIFKELTSPGAQVTKSTASLPEHSFTSSWHCGTGALLQTLNACFGKQTLECEDGTNSTRDNYRTDRQESPNDSAAAESLQPSKDLPIQPGTSKTIQKCEISKRWREKLNKIDQIIKNEETKVTRVGSLIYVKVEEFRISLGSDGTEVYLGYRGDDTEVAIKKMNKHNYQELKHEEQILKLPELDHQLIVRYVDTAKDEDFGYIALQLCEYTLEEYIKNNKGNSLLMKKLVEQFLECLQVLHCPCGSSLSILHRDLKPQNVLIDVLGRVKLADFGISRRLPGGRSTYRSGRAGTKCWMATETLRGGDDAPYKRSTDIQVAGMLIYYILSEGHHPFGDILFKCENNIFEGNYALDHVQDVLAKDLIELMIDKEPGKRPRVEECLSHPFLWTSDRKLGYIQKVGDRDDVKNYRNPEDKLISSLEEHPGTAAFKQWKDKFPSELVKKMEGKKPPYPDNMLALLRFIRNGFTHYQEDMDKIDVMSLFPDLFGVIYTFAKSNKWNSETPLKEMFNTKMIPGDDPTSVTSKTPLKEISNTEVISRDNLTAEGVTPPNNSEEPFRLSVQESQRLSTEPTDK